MLAPLQPKVALPALKLTICPATPSKALNAILLAVVSDMVVPDPDVIVPVDSTAADVNGGGAINM